MTLLVAPFRVVAFTVWFAWQIIVSTATVLADAVTPGIRSRPLVVRMPLDSRTDLEVTVIASLITLTPGTLTLGVDRLDDGSRCLIVHSMYNTDTSDALGDLEDMETRMLHALRLRSRP